MKGLRAALKKDIRLFVSGSGLMALLLPVLLFLALRASGGELLQPPYIEAFAIAVRDEDNTPMSRSLIQQIEEIEIFSEVVRPGQEKSDEECFSQGCAAVITIPEDFFYTMYSMENSRVDIVLNGEMPLESALFQSVITSVMNIIAADQTSAKAVYGFCYGELTDEQERELWRETSQQLILDALGRQGVFANAMDAGDAWESTQRGLLACALSVLCIFFSLTAVKTLPEEFALGILPRYLAAGGRLWAFVLSKLFTAMFLAAPSLALLVLAFRPQRPLALCALVAAFFIAAFGCLLLLAAFLKDAAAVQRAGNLLLLLWLMLGGALYAREFFPPLLQKAQILALPYYIQQGLKMLDGRMPFLSILLRLLPALAAGAALGCLAVFCLIHGSWEREDAAPARKQKPGLGRGVGADAGDTGCQGMEKRKRFARRLWDLSLFKLRAMAGGGRSLVILAAVVAFCGLLAGYALKGEGASSLKLYVVLEEESPQALQLAQRIGDCPGVALIRGAEREGRRYLEDGQAEGLLLVGAGYEEALYGQEELPLYYESHASAVSEQAAREIIAGQVILQKAQVRAVQDAERILGRPLSDEQREELQKEMDEQWDALPPLYEIETRRGTAAKTAAALLSPSQMGFAALAVLLTLLTWGAWTGRRDARGVEERMKVLPGGSFLSYGSDALALWTAGMLAGLCALLPAGEGTLGNAAVLAAYAFCAAGAALALSRYAAVSGRMDALAPFAALITCIVGGCFGDLSQISEAMGRISAFTPQGLALRAAGGQGICLLWLCCMGMVLFLLGAPKEKGKGIWKKQMRKRGVENVL